jgi:hypothetical protein
MKVGRQFAGEFSALLFGEHKFVAAESTALHADVNQFHFMTRRASENELGGRSPHAARLRKSGDPAHTSRSYLDFRLGGNER